MNSYVVGVKAPETNLNAASVDGLKLHFVRSKGLVRDTGSMIFRSATNEEKYSNEQLPYGSNSDLLEVFELMRSLNQKGIEDASIGMQGITGPCLSDAFNQTCDVLARRYKGQSIDYVELGPEPVKTELLLSALRARGVDIASYTSIDINPASAGPMREAVSRVWSKIRIHHLSENFDNLTAVTLGKNNPVIFTSLGFQEGNHPPSQTHDLLTRIMRPGDLFLTEMQLYTPGDTGPIESFYKLDEMKRFSQNCLRRAYGNVDSVYRTTITDVAIDNATFKAAICHEEFIDDGGQIVCFLTNYCLKPTRDELRQLRESQGEFSVVSEITTGDGSLLLQLCERLPVTGPK